MPLDKPFRCRCGAAFASEALAAAHTISESCGARTYFRPRVTPTQQVTS